MFDNIYSTLIRKVPYKVLVFIPIVVSALMLAYMSVNGIPLGIDFKGGTLIEVSTFSGSGNVDLAGLESDLSSLNLEDLRVYSGKDIETGETKVRISTTNVVKLSDVEGILRKYFGDLRESDVATATLSKKSPADLKDKLLVRLRQRIDVSFDEESKMLTLVSMDLDQKELESALKDFTGETVSVSLQERNINIAALHPSLGEKLKNDGLKAAIIGYILMALVVFIAFRNFIPSVAVLLSATCDAVITLGLMSLFGIVLDPASLVALLMLIGYSVDTDILLTSRILKKRKGEVDEGVDSAIKTGLTMTGTTFVVMIVVFIVSTTLTHVATLASIASVLILGLTADVASTWFMNAGILKWYLEERGGKFRTTRRGR